MRSLTVIRVGVMPAIQPFLVHRSSRRRSVMARNIPEEISL